MPSAGAGSPRFAGTLSGHSLDFREHVDPLAVVELFSEAVTRQRGDPARVRRPQESHLRLASANHRPDVGSVMADCQRTRA
jgi:hypothetical protein